MTQDSGNHIVSGAVFLGFPEEAKFIVSKWMGNLFTHHFIVVGVKGLVPVLPKELSGQMEVITRGKFTFIKPLDMDMEFGHVAQIKAKDIHDGLTLPVDGIYQGSMTLMESGSAYYATFNSI